MIVIVTGLSSVGKTSLCKRLSGGVRVIHIDDYYQKVRDDVYKKWKEERKDREAFERDFRNVFIDRVVARLNRAGGTGGDVVIEDILSNIYEYIHRLRHPYRVVLVSTPLRRIYMNLLSRKDRSGGNVLTRFCRFYRPVPSGSGILDIDVRDLELFQGYLRHLDGRRTIMSSGLRQAVKKMRSVFFRDADTRVAIEPVIPVDKNLVATGRLDRDARSLLRYIRSLSDVNEKK